MYVTSFRVSRQTSVGSFQLMIQRFWDIQSDFQNYNLYDDNGKLIHDKNMFVINFIENQLNEQYKEKIINPQAQRKHNLIYFGDKKFKKTYDLYFEHK